MENRNQSTPPNSVAAAADITLPLSPTAMSALGYLFVPLAIVGLVLKQFEEDAAVRFHAVQSILFHATALCGSLALGMVIGMVTAMASMLLGTFQLWGVFRVVTMGASAVSLCLSLAIFAAYVFLIVAAAQGKHVRLPVLGEMAERLAKR